MLQTLITDTVGPVPIYKNSSLPVWSAVRRTGFSISAKICSVCTSLSFLSTS